MGVRKTVDVSLLLIREHLEPSFWINQEVSIVRRPTGYVEGVFYKNVVVRGMAKESLSKN